MGVWQGKNEWSGTLLHDKEKLPLLNSFHIIQEEDLFQAKVQMMSEVESGHPQQQTHSIRVGVRAVDVRGKK